MAFEVVNPWTPVIFKEHYDGFGPEQLLAAKQALAGAKDDGAIWLEEGDARSSITNQSQPPLAYPALRDFFDWQHKKAGELLLETMHLSETIPYWISNTWVNVHGKGGLTKSHSHGMSVLSIAAYLQMPENGGYIEFRDPLFEMHSIHKKSKYYDVQEYHEIPVVTGDVLFFFGWLHHRTQPSQSDIERWVLTTNYTCVQHKEMK
jgi:uncharacterized protein (TIGR02466 family)